MIGTGSVKVTSEVSSEVSSEVNMSYVEVTLERDGFNQPWGLRMMGGVDVGSPLTVSRVSTWHC